MYYIILAETMGILSSLIACIFFTNIIYGRIVSINNPCTLLIDGIITVQPSNNTYIWLNDTGIINSNCNYTMTDVGYASIEYIRIYAGIIITVTVVSLLIIGCLSCYVASFWIERRSMRSRRILRYVN